MKIALRICLLILVCVVLAACVSAKEFRAKLNEADALRDRVGQLEGALEAERNLHRENVSRLEAENRMLQEKNDALIAENTELAGQMESERIDLVRDLTEVKRVLKSEEIRGKEQSDRIDKLEADLAEKEAELEGLHTELDTLREERRKEIEARKEDVSALKDTYDELVSELNEEIQKGRIAVSQLRDKLTLSMVDKILFDSGKSEVNVKGRAVLDRVAEILRKVQDKQIRIEGHTDDVPIGYRLREKFPTNWELSTARATNVVRYLQEEGGLDPSRLSAAGYSEYRPIASNETPEGKASNRRIEIVLVPFDAPVEEPEEEIPLDNDQTQ